MSSSLVVSSVCRSVLYGATGAASPWSCGRMRCERKCSSPDDEALSAPSSSSSLAIKYNAMCCSAPAHIRRHRRAWSPAIFDVHHVKLCAFRCVGSGKPINADVDASISSRTPTPASSSSSSSSSNSILAEMLKRRTASAIIPEWVSHAKARRQPSNTANLGRPQHPSPMPTTASTWMSSGPPITTEIQPHKKHEEKLVRGKERGATRRTSSSSSHLILDPVAWLSQEANAPLVEDLDAILPAHNNNTNDMQNSSTNNSSNVEDEDIFDDVDARTTTTPRRASTKTTSGRRDAANTNTNTTSSSSSSCLVLNPFTGRVGAPTSPQIRSLALLGIGVNEDQRELVVKDRDALRHFSRQLQQQHMRWPIFWNRGRLYRQLREVLADASVEDVAASVAALLQHEYRSLRERRRHAAGVVSSNNNNVDEVRGGSSISSAVEDADARVDAPLNDEQRHVIEFVLEGYNTFIGGSAGTGKSVLLRALRRRLVREGLQVAMTATTGIAGSQLGGTTLHHCLGINLHGDFTRRRELTAYDVIIIDEVSMLPRDVFESMEMHLRHAHGVELPFGGVQIVVCGDFLQLGAIHAQSIISSPIFRRHFAMLKLHSVMRQSESPVYAAQLQQLRMGKLPHNLHETIEFLTAQDVVRERQRLAKVHQQQAQVLRQLTTTPSSSSSSSSSSSHAHEAKEEEVKAATGATPSSPDIAIIDGAVNLLPTNREVDATNARELARLDGDAVTFPAQILAPSLSGSWSSTYILRIPKPDAHQHRRLCHCVNAFISGFAQHLQRDDGAATAAARTAMASHSISAASALTWLRNLSTHPDNVQHQVPLYRIFSDGLALRVRLPPTLPSPTTPGRGCGGDDGERVVIAAFLRYLDGLDAHLEQHAEEIGGIRVREVLTQADGLHTERDEEILMHHIQRSTLAQDLTLKIGARVMLRSNFAPGLVNGSLGTVVGFRRLSVELLSPYLANSATRATAIESYANFLRIEHGFESAMVPEIDFGGGRVEVIPPITHTVGGCANTHFYSLGSVSLPLTLAYAFTVHKVQGLTLVGRVHLELSRMWPCEHLLYVAMSRVRNPEQLSLANFRAELLRVSSDHLLFDLSIPTVEHVRRCAHFIQATWRRCPERRKRQLHQRKVATLRASEKAKKARADRKQVAAIIEEMQEQLSASRGGEISASRE